MNYVFDASFVAALIIPDEKNPQVDRLYDTIENEDKRLSPHLLWYEIANVFMNLIRRKRHTYDEILRLFPIISNLQLTIDSETGIDYTQELLRLCNDFNLSSYDAVYLELAKRKRAVLCTLDKGLRAAAKKCGVAVLK